MPDDIVLYHGMASTCSKKVRMALYEKELPFESHLLDLQKFEQHTKEYLALNPGGVVPTLVYKGKPIIESSIIIEFIEDAFPQKPLRPRDPGAVADMRQWLKFSDNVAYNAVYVPTWSIMAERARPSFTEDKLQAVLDKIPTKERRERWATVAREGFTEQEMQGAYDKMHQCLTRIEKAMAKTQWLAGKEFSLADIAMIPFINRIRNLKPEFLHRAQYPGVNRWEASMRERPSFEKAFDFKDDPRAAELPNM